MTSEQRTAADILHEHGLRPASAAPGRYTTTCPQCSASRTKAHQRSACLGITIDNKGVMWGCNHCGWTGGEFYNGKANGKAGNFAATYNYHNADGNLQFQKIRNQPGAVPPFWCRRPDGRGGWIKGIAKDVARPLYCLPQISEAIASGYTVLIAEGEKDVDNLWRIGLPATCNFDGAAKPEQKPKWKAEYSEQLRGADVVVLNDNDAPGYAHAEATATSLLGIAKRVRRLDLALHWPDMPPKADVSDWLEAGNTREELDALIAKAPDYGPQENEQATTGLGEWDAGDDTELPPPRGWLLGNIFARKFMSSLLAEGGVGKTALRYAQLLSLATGRSLTGDHVFQRCRVQIISLEDDADELRRRILAAALHYKIDRSHLKGWLFLSAPGAAGGKLMTMNQRGHLIRGAMADNIEAVVVARGIDIVSLDPFIKSHSVDENSNSAIDDVVQVLTDLAAKYDIAVDAPHHISKGMADPGNASRGRGASAMKDAGRLVYTLTAMSTDEAKAFGVSEEKRRLLIRMDSGKVNITPPMGAARWFRLVGVPLGNATDTYPSGDEVQTVEPWEPPDTWAGLSADLLNRIKADINAGVADGTRYTDASAAKARAAWRVVQRHAPTKTEAQAREVIKTWVKNGVLVNREYENPVDRKTAVGLYLNIGEGRI